MADAHFLTLPPELSLQILGALCAADRKACRRACSGGRHIINADVRSAQLSASQLQLSAGVQPLAAAFPGLTSLALVDSARDQVRGDALAAFLPRIRGDADGWSLQTLDVKGSNFMTGPELRLLLAACGRLSRLRAPRWTSGAHLRAIADSSPGPPLAPANPRSSPVSCFLVELDLGDAATDVVSVTNAALGQLPPLPNLARLSLRRCTNVSDAGVAHLSAHRLPRLACLDLSGTRVAGTAAAAFAGLAPSLRSLALERCRSLGDAGLAAVIACLGGSGGGGGGGGGGSGGRDGGGSDAGSKGGSGGGARGGLRSLQLGCSAVQPYGSSLRQLAGASALERLDLGAGWEVDEEGLAALACCPRLSDLRLGNFNLRGRRPARLGLDAGAAPAAYAPAAAAAAPYAAQLPSLTRLSLGGMFCQHGLALLLPGLVARGLRRLELAGLSTVRDEVLALLLPPSEAAAGGGSPAKGGASLQELRLLSGGPDLTATGLLRLAALPALRRLELVACSLGAAETATVRQLVEAVRQGGRRLRIEVYGKLPAAAPAPGCGGWCGDGSRGGGGGAQGEGGWCCTDGDAGGQAAVATGAATVYGS